MGVTEMLGYFAIYSGPWADRFGAAESEPTRRRWRFGILPHEIAALNEVQ
jgi:hypothetical protein